MEVISVRAQVNESGDPCKAKAGRIRSAHQRTTQSAKKAQGRPVFCAQWLQLDLEREEKYLHLHSSLAKQINKQWQAH